MRDQPRRRSLANYRFEVTLDTRFTDMDVNRHLNNVAISRLYEEARVRFNRMLWTTHPDLDRPRYLVGHVAIDYLAEGGYPAPVTIGFAVGSLGNTSFRAALGLFQAGACIGLCDTVMVYRGENGPAPLPVSLRAVLGAYLLGG